MRVALVNPNWSFEKSVYFGCREPHLPIEYGYAAALLEAEGHEAAVIDAHLENLSPGALRDRVRSFRPDFTVVTTAPTYLFWRCPPPEMRIPIRTCADLHGVTGCLVAVGPHASTTPASSLRKMGADLAVLGEFEEVLPQLAVLAPEKLRERLKEVSSLARLNGEELETTGPARESDMSRLPVIRWPAAVIGLHGHHHHRFDRADRRGPGAEMEASRGCPYSCTFCSRRTFRGRYRKRPAERVTEELDALIAQGIEYVYFIDEIFLPDPVLLDALSRCNVLFGIQTRIDLWEPEMLDRLGQAGCVSVEAGLESVSPVERRQLNKRDLVDDSEISKRLIHAAGRIPFVQATLMGSGAGGGNGTAAENERWRIELREKGVWVNRPVPLFPYPGSVEYEKRWGVPDAQAWERAHACYLEANREYSDIQDEDPLPLAELEALRE